MKFRMTQWIILSAAVIGLIIGAAFLWPHQPVIAPTTNTAHQNISLTNADAHVNLNTAVETTMFSTADLPDRNAHFSFTLNIPSTWVAAYVSDSQAINFYDPQASAQTTTIAQSKVFVQYYEGQAFTPSTDTTQSRSLTVAGLPAREYTYEASRTTASVRPGFPEWIVTAKHIVLQLQTGTSQPYTYYVFHQRPDLATADFYDMVNSIKINS